MRLSIKSASADIKLRTNRLPEEHNVRFDEPVAFLASCYCPRQYMLFHFSVVIRPHAVNAPLRSKATMRFDDFVRRDTGASFKGIDVLRKARVE